MPPFFSRVVPLLASLALTHCDTSSPPPETPAVVCDEATSLTSQYVATQISTVLNDMRQIVEDPAATVFDGKIVLKQPSGESLLVPVRGLKREDIFVECHVDSGNPSCQTGELTGDPGNFIGHGYRRVLVQPDLIYYDPSDPSQGVALRSQKDQICAAFYENQWKISCENVRSACESRFDQTRLATFSLLNDFRKVVPD